MSRSTTFTPGEKVICNGYSGVVTEICDGVMTGMYIVRLQRGTYCIGGTDPGLQKQCQFCGDKSSADLDRNGHCPFCSMLPRSE